MTRALWLGLMLAGCGDAVTDACKDFCKADAACTDASNAERKACVEDCKLDATDFDDACIDTFVTAGECYAEAACSERTGGCDDELGSFYGACDEFLDLARADDPSRFVCQNGDTVAWQDVCDGISACDGSDEAGCAAPCDPQLFACTDASCIPGGWVCDDFEDCVDASDETGCD